MHNDEHKNPAKESQTGDDLRENSIRGKLPCGARYCHRCQEECGAIVNAYILRDMANESNAADSSLVEIESHKTLELSSPLNK